jgi:hypothetical protein
MQVGKLIYCTRTVPEMEKVLAELQVRDTCALSCTVTDLTDSRMRCQTAANASTRVYLSSQ